MKSMDLIRGEIEALCQRHKIAVDDRMLTVFTAYVVHEIIDARQAVFDTVVSNIKKGVAE